MKLSTLFYKCINITYTQVENGADFALERINKTLYIYFEHSDGYADWKHNLNFPAKAYKRMGKTVWFAHGGFLKVWKTIEVHIKDYIMDRTLNKIVIVGFSHGAAIAALCHEYVWFHRPELRDTLEGYGFGCPRVFWGLQNENVRDRWHRFAVIRNIDDIVTHLPLAIFGFSHVGKLYEIGKKGKYSPINAHRPENILAELRVLETNLNGVQILFNLHPV